jgi:signal transduction histidine kinase
LTITEAYQHRVTLKAALALIILAALSGSAGVFLHQELQSSAMLRNLTETIRKIAPHYSSLDQKQAPASSTSALQAEIHSMALNWRKIQNRGQGDIEKLQVEHQQSLEDLARGVSHEVRNPLAGLAGAIEIISKDFPSDHPDQEILVDMRKEVRRVERLMSDFVAYARYKAPQFTAADLHDTVERTLQIAREQIGDKKVEFLVQLPSGLPHLRMDPEQIYQVLLNLVSNGIQAIDNAGTITLQAQLRQGSDIRNASNTLEIMVSDTGGGISRDRLERVFRPFYTTKPGSAGLGLSLSRRIIGQHGGTLIAESEVHQGTRFLIKLPVSDHAEEKTQPGT